ncbi:MAG: D-glucuronyl C5-epimerase family protein [Thermoleophilia bacterium]
MHIRRHALATAVLLIAPAAVALHGGSESDAAPAAAPPSTAAAVAATAPLGPPTPAAAVLVRSSARAKARARAARKRRAAARRTEVRRLRRSRTVAGALRRALLTHAISRREHDGMRRIWWRANRDMRRLRGVRRAELSAVLAMASRLAAARVLTASRLEPVFLTVRRNREFWTSRALPRPGARLTFPRDPVVFEYYSGRGLAIQPLASFGKANALAGACVRSAARHRCRPAALRRLLGRMVDLGTERGGFLAWEYFFRFGRGAPPWISAMTQATGAQALARGRRALGEVRFARAARRALGAFDRPPPVGVAVRTARGARYAMYSFAPRLRIYNGELQALIGLRDVARISRSRRAQRLFAAGEPVARRAVPALDTGAWSLYSEGGAESTLSYHRLVGGFLDAMCSRTSVRTYCAAGRRFARYVREAPRVRLRAAGPLRTRRRSAITFTLSKVSDVIVEVRDRTGRVAFARGMRLTRGRHRFVWAPRRVGRHGLRIVAIGPAATRSVVKRTLYAKAVRNKPARKSGNSSPKAERAAGKA